MRRFRCNGSLSGTPLIFRKGLGLESKRVCSLFILDPRIMAPTISVAASAQLPWRHDGATPPQEWLRLLATELLESKVSADWLADEWRSAAQDCLVPLVCTTGDLRTRHEKYPDV